MDIHKLPSDLHTTPWYMCICIYTYKINKHQKKNKTRKNTQNKNQSRDFTGSKWKNTVMRKAECIFQAHSQVCDPRIFLTHVFRQRSTMSNICHGLRWHHSTSAANCDLCKCYTSAKAILPGHSDSCHRVPHQAVCVLQTWKDACSLGPGTLVSHECSMCGS